MSSRENKGASGAGAIPIEINSGTRETSFFDNFSFLTTSSIHDDQSRCHSSFEEKMQSRNMQKKHKNEVLLIEAKNTTYKMQEYFCQEELTKKIYNIKNQNVLKEHKLEENKKKLQEINMKIKVINKFKKLIDLEMKIAAILEGVAEKPYPEFSEDIEIMKKQLINIQGLTLKNFSEINDSKKVEVLQVLQDLFKIMESIDIHINSSEISNIANLLSTVNNKLKELTDIITRCESVKNELNRCMLKIFTSKIGLRSMGRK